MSNKTRKMVLTALSTAILCVIAPFSIPLAGGVSITLAVLAVCLMPYLIGMKNSIAAIVIYILIGAIGVPVFSDFSGGVDKLVGPTGGYLVGYIFLAVIGGAFVEKSEKRLYHALGFLIGLALLYALGTAWFMFVTKNTLSTSLKYCVLPFVPIDAVKIAVAVTVGPMLKKRLAKAKE